MSDVSNLIEKLGLAIHGEQPQTVIDVLTHFTIACLEQWGMSLDDYIERLKFYGKSTSEGD